MPVTLFRSLRFALAFSLVAVLVACKPAPLEVRTYSSDATFAINAHLLVGEREAVLIDTGFYRSDAQQIVELIRSTGRELRYIVYTHAHPDHYFGADIIRDAFPGVPVEATLGVYLDFQANAQATYNTYKAQLGNQIADRLIAPFLLPQRWDRVSDRVRGPHAASPRAAAGGREQGRRGGRRWTVHASTWPATCSTTMSISFWPSVSPRAGSRTSSGCAVSTPRRSIPGTARWRRATAALDAARDYIDAAVPILNAAATADEAKTQLVARFPNHAGSGLLDFSVTQYFSRCR